MRMQRRAEVARPGFAFEEFRTQAIASLFAAVATNERPAFIQDERQHQQQSCRPAPGARVPRRPAPSPCSYLGRIGSRDHAGTRSTVRGPWLGSSSSSSSSSRQALPMTAMLVQPLCGPSGCVMMASLATRSASLSRSFNGSFSALLRSASLSRSFNGSFSALLYELLRTSPMVIAPVICDQSGAIDYTIAVCTWKFALQVPEIALTEIALILAKFQCSHRCISCHARA